MIGCEGLQVGHRAAEVIGCPAAIHRILHSTPWWTSLLFGGLEVLGGAGQTARSWRPTGELVYVQSRVENVGNSIGWAQTGAR